MKAKTQKKIGLWGAVFIIGLGIFGSCYLLFEWSSLFLLDVLIFFAFPMLPVVIYIFYIFRKNLKMAKIMYRIWLFVAVIILFLHASIDILALMGMLYLPFEWVDLISFLFWVAVYGFITLILRTGLKGLQRIIEAENESMIENTSQTD